MSGGMRMAAEMAEQPAVLRRLIDTGPELRARVRELLPPGPVRVVIVARGSSDHAAVYGRYVLEHATASPVAIAAPSLLTRYKTRTRYDGHLAIAVSQSGRTPEIVTALTEMRKRGAATIAITNDASSPLAQAADLPVDLRAGAERAVPATKTFTAQLAVFALIAQAIGPVPWLPSAWDTLAPAVESVLEDAEPVNRVTGEIEHATGLVAMARGFLFAAALETALKLKETTSLLAQGYSATEFRHGPIAVVEPGFPVLALNAGGPCAVDVLEAAETIRARGGQVISVQSNGDLPIDGRVPEALAVIPVTVRGQQLSLALSRRRGLDPDDPAGLSKVTATV